MQPNLPGNVPVAVGTDGDGNPIDVNGNRIPVNPFPNPKNTRPGAGYGPVGGLNLTDVDWIPEFGAGDAELRAATTRQAIVDRLTAKYASRNWDFSDLLNSNYQNDTLSVEAAREAAQAFDDMITKYPFLTFESDPPGGVVKPLRAIYDDTRPANLAGQTSNAFAMPNAVWNWGKWNYTGAEYVSVNEPIATRGGRNSAWLAYRNGRRDSETRDYNLDAMNRPTYYTMIHEMGHVMDFNGKGNSHARIEQYLQDVFDDSDVADELAQLSASQQFTQRDRYFRRWLSTQLVSAYSYKSSDRSLGSYTVETIAEAFLDVEARGANANYLSKEIHRIVVEEAMKAKGVI